MASPPIATATIQNAMKFSHPMAKRVAPMTTSNFEIGRIILVRGPQMRAPEKKPQQIINKTARRVGAPGGWRGIEEDCGSKSRYLFGKVRVSIVA